MKMTIKQIKKVKEERLEREIILRKALEDKGYAHKEFASKLGVHPTVVGFWLAHQVSPKYVMRVAESLDLAPEQLRPDIFY